MPSRASKEAKRGPSSTRPKKRRPKATDGGRTPQEAALAGNMAAQGNRVSQSNRRVAAPSSAIDPALLMNAATGLTTTPAARREVAQNLAATESADPLTWADLAEMTGIPGAARAAADMAGTTFVDIPGVKQAEAPSGSDAADLALTALALTGVGAAARLGKGVKGAKGAEKGAQGARKGSQAAKVAKTNKAEKAAAKARIKANRAKMTRGEAAKDRARNARIRAQVKLYDEAYKITAGTGAAGGGALTAREIAKQSGSKGAAARALAREGARKTATAPARAGSAVNRAALSPALFPVTGALPADQTARNVASIPYQIAAATAENPGAVAKASLESGRDMLLGAPAAVYEMATNPLGALEMMKDDYAARYGPLVRGDFKYFRDNMAEMGGLTPFALDTLIAAPAGGAVVGRAGRAGALGKTAENFMVKDRPKLLKEVGVKPVDQPLSVNAAGVAAQRILDRARTRKTATGARGNRSGSESVAHQAAERGAVIALRNKRVQALTVARPKSGTRLTQLSQQGRAQRNFALVTSQMDQGQLLAMKWAIALGIRTPDQARVRLTKQIAFIKANRTPDTQFGKLDNIPEIKQVMAQADEIFTPEYADSIALLNKTEEATIEGNMAAGIRVDPGLTRDQAALRRVAQQAEHLGIQRADGEATPEYMARVQAAADEAGLAPGGYFPSELSRQRRFGVFTSGGARFSERSKAYTGALFREGIENNDPALWLRSNQRSIKRRNVWELAADVMQRNSFPWSRDELGNGRSRAEIQRYMGENGIDAATVGLINPEMIRSRVHQDLEPGEAETGSVDFGNAYMDDLGSAVQTMAEAADGPDFKDGKGWLAVPIEVLNELESGYNTTKLGRSADIAMSKMSGYLLAFNTGWLGFQTISTAVQAMIAGVTPMDYLLAQIWFYKFNREAAATGTKTRFGMRVRRHNTPTTTQEMLGNAQADRLNATVGISQAQDVMATPQFGSKVPGSSLIQGAVEGHRIFREGKWGQALRKTNPIQAWFKLAMIPENANRRALAYKMMKSETVKRMNVNVKKTDAAITKITASMKLDPEDQMRSLIDDRLFMEEMADGLADFLGDYQTFTGIERTVFKRTIPFYSWMRFATKFALFTLPSKHPIATGLVYQLGQMKSEELREVLGDAMGWALGKMFLGDPNDTDTPFIDIYRGNPLLSTLVEIKEPKDLMGLLPPYAAIALNPMYGRDQFTRQDILVDGETEPRRFNTLGLENYLQVMFAQGLDTFTPYRVASEIAYEGTPQTDDAFPIDLGFVGGPEPKRYAPGSGEETRAREEGEFQRDGGALGVLLRRGAPFYPQDSTRIRDQANYINAETAREEQTIRDYQKRGTGKSNTPTNGQDIMDAIKSRTGGSTGQKILDDIKERIGQ